LGNLFAGRITPAQVKDSWSMIDEEADINNSLVMTSPDGSEAPTSSSQNGATG
jgi:hypothetical protein